MGKLLLGLVWMFIHVKHQEKALLALDKSPVNTGSQPFRSIAVSFFLLGAALVCAAALTDWFAANDQVLSSILGWSGLASFQGCVVFGILYGNLNISKPTKLP
jgi:hypothetical protein